MQNHYFAVVTDTHFLQLEQVERASE